MSDISITGAIYTVGHSNHTIESFIGLLTQHSITAIADVRSSPVSIHHPQFNRDILASALKNAGIEYIFMGKELGGRPAESTYYTNGQADYEKMAEKPEFKEGINRLIKGKDKYRIALLCAEKEPLDCHRTVLVSNALQKLGIQIKHILADGGVEDHQETERRLIKTLGLEKNLFDMNVTDSERIDKAYVQQAHKIAYKIDSREESKVMENNNTTSMITLFTIGFTKKSARSFFSSLKMAGVKRIIDIRLNNESQLAGFTKKEDLRYFLKAIADIDYVHRIELAPTKEILNDYKKKKITWPDYERLFIELLNQRKPEATLQPAELDKACLLCSEPKADQCHRRLVAEYLHAKMPSINIQHL